MNETPNKGVYVRGRQYAIEDSQLITWMAEASLHARTNQSAALGELLGSPSIFPFALAYVSAEQMTSLSSRLNISRQGTDENLLMLRE